MKEICGRTNFQIELLLLMSSSMFQKTKQNKTKKKQNKTKQNKTKQNKTKQNKTKQNKTKHNKTQQTKPNSLGNNPFFTTAVKNFLLMML